MRYLLSLSVLAVCCLSASADVAELVKKLSSANTDERRRAASELGDSGPDAVKAVKPLIKALKDRDLYVRRFAAGALAKIGPAAKDAIPALTVMLSEARPAARDAAIRALGQMGPAAVPALSKAAGKTYSADVQEKAIAALAKSGPTGLPALLTVVKEPTIDASLRRKALEGIKAVGPSAAPTGVPVLTAVVKDPKARGREARDFRNEAIRLLGMLARPSDSSALAVLDGIAKDEKGRDKRLKKMCADTAARIRAKK